MDRVPAERITPLNDCPVKPGSEFVLYWMTAFRRARWNFSLDRATEWAVELNKPLVVLEALRCDYPWASERLHSFVLDGMRGNRNHFSGAQALYYPFVERTRREGRGLVEALASMACVIVADDYPAFFLPRMIRAAAERLPVRMEAVDSNGLLPLRATDRIFSTAFSFRRFLQATLPEHLNRFPSKNPLEGVSIPVLRDLPPDINARWPAASDHLLRTETEAVSSLELDHTIKAVETRGGAEAARDKLDSFLKRNLHRYHIDRNHPDEDAASGLSPYLHFGHVSSHEVFSELKEAEEWSPETLPTKASGHREGWWGMSEGAEAFLDQLVTWRELGFNLCSKRDDYDRLESLPDWALKELRAHREDVRPYIYSIEVFESAETHDPVWNAAQRQLLQEGTIHNTMRMLWGKKILEWSSSPAEALKIMVELNNKYALDGRDPNSYTGIFWILGRYDRPFGPSRRVFGKIRYMSSGSTIRKKKIQDYLHRYGERGK